MSKFRIAALILLVVMSATSGAAQEPAATADPWAMVRALEGVWTGEGEGFGQSSSVTHHWEFILGGKFLRLQTRSASESSTGETEIHQDVGYVSWSESEGVLRFRQFLSEGFVNSFILASIDPPDGGFDFEPVSTDGMDDFAVRMTLRFADEESYEMVLEMGTKGEVLQACQTMQLKKQE